MVSEKGFNCFMNEIKRRILEIPMHWDGKPSKMGGTLSDVLEDRDVDAILSAILQALPEDMVIRESRAETYSDEFKQFVKGNNEALAAVRNILNEARDAR